jgi:hypothetical protein
MKTLIKWLAVAALAGGALYGAVNYNVVVTPVAAQEATEVCVTLDAVEAEVAKKLAAQSADYTVLVYTGVVADNFIGNLLGKAGYDQASIETAQAVIETVAIFSSPSVDSSLLVIFDTTGCKLGHSVVPNVLIEMITGEANVA